MVTLRRSQRTLNVGFSIRHSIVLLMCLLALALTGFGVHIKLTRSIFVSKSIELQIQQHPPSIKVKLLPEQFATHPPARSPDGAPMASSETTTSSIELPVDMSLKQISLKEPSQGLAIVMFSHLKTTERFDNLFFPALETWWQNEKEPLYIVLTHQWRTAYEELCRYRDCRQFYPLWVNCTEGQFGESPCCKQEKGLLALPKDYEWTLFADDDMYFKIADLRRYLMSYLAVDPSEPYIVTAGGVTAKFLGQWGYKGKRADYICSSTDEFRYPWGQPVIYSRAALHLVEPGLRAGGLVKQCLEFQVTHDAGNSIFHWMYQIPDFAIKFHMFPGEGIRKEYFGVHGIHRFITSVNHTVTMKEVHSQAINQTKRKFKMYMRQRHHRKGFLESDTFARFGDPSTWGDQWHTMPVRDCMDREMRSKSGQHS